MTSASLLSRTARKRRTSLHPLPKVPHLRPWQAWVSRVPGAAATIIPFDVRHKVETIHARRTRASAHREPDPPAGANPIGSLRQRGRATVQGRLHAAEVRPGGHDSRMLACEVADSTGELTAVLYGRTQIAGLEPGRRVRLHGMVGIGADGRPP